MGLFGVNMPPLYGEGSKAFYRLQLEILKDSDDESLFAWTDQRHHAFDPIGGMLAPSPAAFSDSGNVSQIFDVEKPEYTMTNRGLRMELLLPKKAMGILVAPLNCSLGTNKQLGIPLLRGLQNQFQFHRLTSPSHITLDDDKHQHMRVRTLIYVRNPQLVPHSYDTKTYIFEFTTGNLLEHGFGFPGSLFVGNPKHPQARVDGITNIKFSLKARRSVHISLPAYACEFVTFLPKEKVWERGFSVRLQTNLVGPSISLLVPVSPIRVDRWSALDRVSAPLHSGMSVNVALKVRGEGFERKCVVDVNIDPEGKLRWHSSRTEGLDPANLGVDESPLN
jgi:hypothetical protein